MEPSESTAASPSSAPTRKGAARLRALSRPRSRPRQKSASSCAVVVLPVLLVAVGSVGVIGGIWEEGLPQGSDLLLLFITNRGGARLGIIVVATGITTTTTGCERQGPREGRTLRERVGRRRVGGVRGLLLSRPALPKRPTSL